MTQSKHLAWAENARGIAIFLVVLGHGAVPEELKAAVYAFHMHLFFFLSGHFFRTETSLPQLAAKKTQTLMWPYLVYSLLSFCVIAFRIKIVHGIPGTAPLWGPFLGIFSLSSFWFLPVLFLTTILFYLICRFVTWRTYPALVVCLAGLHWLTESYALMPYVGAAVHALNALVFFAFGYLYAQKYTPSDWRVGLGALIIFLPTFFIGYPKFGLETIGITNNYLYAYTLAFSGILFTIHIAKRIPQNAILTFLGANSLLIYLLHGYPGAIYSRVFSALSLQQHITYQPLYGLLQTLANLAILAPVIWIINKHFAWTLGRFNARPKTPRTAP